MISDQQWPGQEPHRGSTGPGLKLWENEPSCDWGLTTEAGLWLWEYKTPFAWGLGVTMGDLPPLKTIYLSVKSKYWRLVYKDNDTEANMQPMYITDAYNSLTLST